jgi:hypothetical protein
MDLALDVSTVRRAIMDCREKASAVEIAHKTVQTKSSRNVVILIGMAA